MKIQRQIFIFSVLICFIMMWTCGNSPSNPPPLLTGTIKITAQIDSVAVDSVEVFLNGISRGVKENPCLFSNLEAGNHQVAVAKKDKASPIDYNSIPQIVAVEANKTADVIFPLTKFAPNFTLTNLNNDEVTLENYHGKVVLLVFFSHT